MQMRWALLGLVLGLATASEIHAQQLGRRALEYAPAPVDNPLKGLVPYQADVRSFFPHSMEFNYLSYGALVRGYDEYNWQPLEALLDDIASRGHQAVFRIYLEYPDKKGVIPKFLIEDGLKVHKYLNTNTQPLPPAQVETPDYEDPNLRRSLRNFIAALGAKYDGDPRIGFITAGLLGTWGEWHTYPKEELFASKDVQNEVMDAYEAAFRKTPVLLRYPAGVDAWGKAPNAQRRFGYHDDSFAWATLHTGKEDEDWFFMTLLQTAGPEALSKWQSAPIGGEIRPEAWVKVFDANPRSKSIQNFIECVEATHASWLMDSGMFEKKQKPDRVERAIQNVRRLGYEFHCPAVVLDENRGGIDIDLELENRGVAPFYYDWPAEFGCLKDGKANATATVDGKLYGLLPGDAARHLRGRLDTKGLSAGRYAIGVRVANALANGKPIRFANATQDADAEGWLTIGEIDVR
jgi:hypothetical protein